MQYCTVAFAAVRLSQRGLRCNGSEVPNYFCSGQQNRHSYLEKLLFILKFQCKYHIFRRALWTGKAEVTHAHDTC
jgi:hypothetical protein